MRQFIISRFSGKADARPRRDVTTLAVLAELFTSHEVRESKDGPCWSPASFSDDERRRNELVERLDLLALDFDCGIRPEQLEHLWEPYEHYVYSSFHNGIEKSEEEARCRFRLVIPLAEPVSAAEWPSFWSLANDRLADGQADPQCKEPSRMYYLPAHPERGRGRAFSFHRPGRLLEPSEMTKKAPIAPHVKEAGVFPVGERNSKLFKLAMKLLEGGVPADRLQESLHQINRSFCSPPLSNEEVRAIAKSAASREPQDSRFLASPYMSSEKASFSLTRLDHLLLEPPEETAWVVEDLLPAGGISILAAKPKVGKSTLARCLLAAVAGGSEILGRQVESPGKALYFALEEKRSEVARHFRQLVGQEMDQSLIHVHSGPASERALEDLAAVIQEHRPVLVVIDPLLLFVRARDASDYTEMIRVLEPVRVLARELGPHIMVVHHNGKMQRDDGDGVLGSTAIFGTVDTLIDLRKTPAGRVARSIQRYGTDLEDLLINFDSATGRIQAGGRPSDVKHRETEAIVLELLRRGPASEEEVRSAASCDNRAVGSAIRNLLDAGHISRTGSGRRGDKYIYTLAETLETPLDVGECSGVEVF